MPHYHLLLGAGFSRNWGGSLSEEITGSLLGELQDQPELSRALRQGPFEDAFQGFVPAPGPPQTVAKQRLFQDAVMGVFSRLNRTFVQLMNFEFNPDRQFSVKDFLARFDAIFTLNQDLLLEIHYMQTFIQQRGFNSVVLPGMRASTPAAGTGPFDFTATVWRPTADFTVHPGSQPLFKLHGSSNWESQSGEALLIMGNAKSGAIERFPVLRHYHDQFARSLCAGNARLMVIGYSFQDEHINSVIDRA
jgi:hypothetical protein